MDLYGPFARFYDIDLAGRDSDLLMIEQFCAGSGSPILELACGTGRLLVPLARQGYQITGVDASPAMLEHARRKLREHGLDERVILVEQDIRELRLDERYNFAFLVLNSFMHLLTVDDQLAALNAIRRHLKPGALLLLDLFNPELGRLLEPAGQVNLEKVMTDPGTGNQVIKFTARSVDHALQTMHVTYVIEEVDGRGAVRRTLFPFSLRYLFRGELELLLRSSGFELEALYGSYDLDAFASDSERLIAVARRPG